MAIIEKDQQQAAQAFVQYWQEARGNERSETQKSLLLMRLKSPLLMLASLTPRSRLRTC